MVTETKRTTCGHLWFTGRSPIGLVGLVHWVDAVGHKLWPFLVKFDGFSRVVLFSQLMAVGFVCDDEFVSNHGILCRGRTVIILFECWFC